MKSYLVDYFEENEGTFCFYSCVMLEHNLTEMKKNFKKQYGKHCGIVSILPLGNVKESD